MTEDEVDVVAAELAKAGGVSWYPGRERGPLKIVSDRYRDRARLAITALDRYRASRQDPSQPASMQGAQHEPGPKADLPPASDNPSLMGRTVLYRPPGDRRAYPCRIEATNGGRVYLVPDIKTCTGWVDAERLLPGAEDEASKL